MTYHINPETGNPGVCRAKLKCRFNLKENEHFPTHAIASTAYENLMSAREKYGDIVSHYKMNLEPGVEQVLSDLTTVGAPLIVGGAVRDSLIGVESKDVDIEVHGTTIDEISKHLKSNGYIVDEVGRQFGVLKVQKTNVVKDIDVSVPRRENRVGAGHRSFEVELDENMTVLDAAERRDFTFNAMMYDHKRNVLVDPVGGEKDFKNGIMRHVSDKFAEDPLRVLRGFQFASRFNMRLHPDTATMCKSLRSEYSTLSEERVTDEWEKFYSKSRYSRAGIRALQEAGWADTIPGLDGALRKEYVSRQLDEMNNQELSNDEKIIFGASTISEAILKPENKELFIRKTVLGNREQAKAIDLMRLDPKELDVDDKKIREKAFELSNRGFTFGTYDKYAKLSESEWKLTLIDQAKRLNLMDGPEPDLMAGKDIIGLTDRKPGPWMGQLLKESRDLQYSGLLRDRESALSWAKEKINKLNLS